MSSFIIVAFLALLSNLIGYFRDAVLAGTFGASAITDSYFTAFFIPNTLYMILVASSLSQAFLPIFVEYINEDCLKAWEISSLIINLSTVLLAGIVALGVATSNYWIPLITPGFSASSLQLSVRLTYILFPMILFIGLSSLVTTMLNSLNHFTVSSLAPIISSMVVIIGIIVANTTGSIYPVAFATLLGSIVQLFIQIPILKKYGFKYTFFINLRHPALYRLLKLTLPMMAYLGVAYMSVVIERRIASTMPEGSITFLNYAMRLFALPATLFASSLGTVIYPHFSSLVALEDNTRFENDLLKAIQITFLVLTPISIWIMINSRLIVDLLYGFGRFSIAEVDATALILAGYAIGMMPFGVTGILQRGLYSVKNTKLPLVIETINLVTYFLFAKLLSSMFGLVGLAFSRAISFCLVAVLTFWGTKALRKRTYELSMWIGRGFLLSFFIALIATAPVWFLSLIQLSIHSRLLLLLESGFGAVFGALAYILLIRFKPFQGYNLLIAPTKKILTRQVETVDHNQF